MGSNALGAASILAVAVVVVAVVVVVFAPLAIAATLGIGVPYFSCRAFARFSAFRRALRLLEDAALSSLSL